jgi:20S proteasome alpha/beta subunit
MTIAAGFVYSEGVLVCADSQMTVGAAKVDGSKVGKFETSWGQIIASFAGNVDYAAAAFQALERAGESEKIKDEPIDGIECFLSARYETHVFGHPQQKSGDYDYSLFLGIRLNAHKTARLYRTSETILREVKSFDCAGSGEDFGRDVLRLLHSPDLSIERAVALASYMLSHTKDRIQYCGGQSMVRMLRHDGSSLDNTEDLRLAQLSRHIEISGNWFVWESQKFLMRHALGDMEQFARTLTVLDSRATFIRNIWEEAIQSGRVDRRSTIPDQSNLPPWPE